MVVVYRYNMTFFIVDFNGLLLNDSFTKTSGHYGILVGSSKFPVKCYCLHVAPITGGAGNHVRRVLTDSCVSSYIIRLSPFQDCPTQKNVL